MVWVVALCSCNNIPQIPITDAEERLLLDHISRINDTAGPKKCIEFIDSASKNFTLSTTTKFKIYNRKHTIYLHYLPDMHLARLYADSMYHLATSDPAVKEDTGFKFNAYLAMADAAFSSDKYDVAFKYYNLARELVSNSAFPCKESSYLFRIGMAYYRSGKYLHAAHLFKQSAEKLEQCNKMNFIESFRGQETISNIGVSYEKAGMPDSAIYYYYKTLNYITINEPQFPTQNHYWDVAVSVIQGNIGSAYILLGNKDSAEHYLLKSISLSENISGDMGDRIFNKLKLASIFIEDGRLAEAKTELLYCDSLKSHIQRLGFSNDTLEIAYRLSDIHFKYHIKLNNYSDAIKYLNTHHNIHEQKWLKAQKIIVNDLEQGIIREADKQKIGSLEKDVKINKLRTAVLVLLVLVSVLLILYIRRVYKKRHQSLEQQNKKIVSESAEVEEKLQNKIKKDQQNFLSLIENTDDFLWSVDKNFVLLAFNKAYRKGMYQYFGAYPEVGEPELLIQAHAPLFYNKLITCYQRVLAGLPYEPIEKGIRHNNEEPDIEVRFRPIVDEHGVITGVSCYRRDITEYLKLIKILEKNNKQLLSIAWVQSHKLRGPLTTIQGIINYLNNNNPDSENYTHMLDGLKDAVSEMDKVIHEIVEETD
jgi:tetratricopeptide (TPR) repeat protein